MIYTISKPNKNLIGTINLPTSKSESNRALIINELCKTRFNIFNLSDSDDTQTLLHILQNKNNQTSFDVGAAGTTMRFLTSYFSIIAGTRTLTGSERMKQRPINVLVDSLRSVGATIDYLEEENYPPLMIRGNTTINGGSIEIDSNISSQYITSLLLIAPVLENGLTLNFKNDIVSESYIKMTLKMLSHFGIMYSQTKNTITIPHQEYVPIDYTIEGDWSAASYWYAMAAMSDNVSLIIKGLKKNSLQGDSVVSTIFQSFGVHTEFMKDGIKLSKHNNVVTTFDYDFINCPDLAQTVAVTMVGLGIKGELSGLKTLKIKETDRILALKMELCKLGVNINITEESISIQESKLINTPNEINTYKDHRMAMAFSTLSTILDNIKINDPNVVTKSYPTFFDDMKTVEFEIDSIM